MSTSDALSVVALLISTFALAFSWLQWRESHNQLLLSMRPSVSFEIGDDANEPPIGIGIRNSGPGPAVIQSIAYYVDMKLVGDVYKLVEFAGFGEHLKTCEFDRGDTLAVGEQRWLVGYQNWPHGKNIDKDLNQFVDFTEHHLGVEVSVCPVIPGECFTRCSVNGWCK